MINLKYFNNKATYFLIFIVIIYIDYIDINSKLLHLNVSFWQTITIGIVGIYLYKNHLESMYSTLLEMHRGVRPKYIYNIEEFNEYLISNEIKEDLIYHEDLVNKIESLLSSYRIMMFPRLKNQIIKDNNCIKGYTNRLHELSKNSAGNVMEWVYNEHREKITAMQSIMLRNHSDRIKKGRKMLIQPRKKKK